QAERHYHYDNNYLLTQVDDSRLGKLSYQYDPIGRLIKAQNPYRSESFSFDPAGNLIDPIATQTSQVKNNLITQYQGKHYKYDAQGNVIETTQSGETLKLTWDNLNRLIQSDHNGQITSYGYDVFGRRLFKKNTTEDSLTLFGWDGDLMIWESQRSNKEKENYTKHYVYEPDSFVPLLQTGYTRFIQLIETPDYRQFLDVPYSIYKDPVWKTDTQKNKAELERVAFYHCDQVGTPQTLSNELGECIWEIKQDTWGTTQEIKTTNESNPLEQSNLRFQGQYYDKETGLHYNRYRYYEPYSARYVSKDPIGLNGGMNSTVYVNDPNQWVDPMGLDWSNAFSPGLMQYGRSKVSEHNWKMQNDPVYRNQVMTPPAPVKAATHVPYTTMTNVNLGLTAIAGGSVGVGAGHTRDQYGKIMQCVAVTVCGSAGAEASAYGSGGQSYTNTDTSRGFSNTGSACVSGKAAALGGGGVQACQNSDGSQTYAGNAIVGGALGASGSVCYAVNYCR
ncbi:RHS repeat-associated core domain-containing protein, partial [Acinetobacter bereziniae]|uniref:RHS repeat-associated core domain-containing protein n=1 Tax=Acinetobacter bereziniae TaxID=106648 RepID=UPI001D17DD7B